jgi:hypothetical protein
MTPAESTNIPVKYYSLDTTLTVIGQLDRVTNPIEDIGIDNQIQFSKFLIDSQQYIQASNFYSVDNKKTWDKVLEKDKILMLAIFLEKEQQQKRKVLIAATIYRRKIFIANRGNQKETAHVFLIKLKPLMVIQNCLPRSIRLTIDDIEETNKIEPNERYIYKLPKRITESTSLKVGLVNQARLCEGGRFTTNSSSCRPFDNKSKKGKTLSIRLEDQNDKRNRLFLKIEIRKYSSNTICCYIYSPFLVYNETEFPLRYKSSNQELKSGVYQTCVTKETTKGFELSDHWQDVIDDLQQNETNLQEGDNSYEISEDSSNKSFREGALEDFYSKVANSFDIYCPDRVTQSLKISIEDSGNWSNAFILRFKESSSFLIKQNKQDAVQTSSITGENRVSHFDLVEEEV